MGQILFHHFLIIGNLSCLPYFSIINDVINIFAHKSFFSNISELQFYFTINQKQKQKKQQKYPRSL